MSERVTMDDIRRSGHCARGLKAWFDQQGLDFRRFVREGMTVEEFTSTGDGQGLQVVERKRQREASKGT